MRYGALIIMLPILCFADLILEYENRIQGEKSISKAYLEGRNFRLDSLGKGNASSLLYNAKRLEFYLIDHKSKTAYRYTVADLMQNKKKTANTRKRLTKKIKVITEDLPPKEKEKIRYQLSEQYKSLGMSMLSSKLKIQKKKPQKIMGKLAKVIEAKQEGDLIKRIWLLSPKNFRVATQDAIQIREMNKQIYHFLKSIGQDSKEDSIDLYLQSTKQAVFLPALSQSFVGGELVSQSKLKSVKKSKLKANFFRPSPKYKLKRFQI